MINEVSDRIRKIIRSQDQTPQSQFYKSRDNSVDSNRSGPRSIAPVPPKSPSKMHSQSQRSDVPQTNKAGGKDDDQLVERIKDKVMEVVIPLLVQLSRKVEAVTEGQVVMVAYVKEIEAKWANVNALLDREIKRIQANLETMESKMMDSISNETKRMFQEYSRVERKLGKQPSLLEFQTVNLKEQLEAKNSSRPRGIERSLGKSQPLEPACRCKCQKLVEEILKSQNHLMMELKYVKHFQGGRQVNAKGETSGGHLVSRDR